MHVYEYVSKLTTIGPDIGLALTRQQAIIWTNGGAFTDVYMPGQREATMLEYCSLEI